MGGSSGSVTSSRSLRRTELQKPQANSVELILITASRDGFAVLVIAVTADPCLIKSNFSNGLLRKLSW